MKTSPLFKTALTPSLSRRLTYVFLAAIAAVACWLPAMALPNQALANEPRSVTGLNVFGDSLVDAGNIFNLTNFPPSPPYAQKFSNGPLWVEQLAQDLNLSSTLATVVLPNLQAEQANPQTKLQAGTSSPPTAGINFALAGSLSSNLNAAGSQLPGLTQQIESFAALSASAPTDPNAVAVMLVGGNDYNTAVSAPTALASSLEILPNRVTDNIIRAATALIDAGAQRLLVSNLPDLSAQPQAAMLNRVNPQSTQWLRELSTQHNQLLSQKLTALAVSSGAEIIQLDLAGLLSNIVQNPATFGFTNVTEPCLTNFRQGFQFDGVCKNPDEYLFWDEVHPTEAGHRAIAQRALDTLTKAESASPNDLNDPQDTQSLLGPTSIFGALAGTGAIALFIHHRKN